jgi:hypothetical protein
VALSTTVLWALAAALSGIGRRETFEVADGVLTMRVESRVASQERQWRIEDVVDVIAGWRRVVLKTRDDVEHTLAHWDDRRDVREIAHALGAGLGVRPPGQPPDAEPLPARRPVRKRVKPAGT